MLALPVAVCDKYISGQATQPQEKKMKNSVVSRPFRTRPEAERENDRMVAAGEATPRSFVQFFGLQGFAVVEPA